MQEFCTFVLKERNVFPKWCDSYVKNIKTGNDMTLWKNDRGNAAAILIAKSDIKKAALKSIEVIDENGNVTTKVRMKASFQKYISTYKGSNWIPEPRPFQLPALPDGNRTDIADVIYGTEIERDMMRETGERIIQPFWISVSVGKDATPGKYKGKIQVTIDGEKTLELFQNIKVLDLELEESSDYYLNLWQYPYASAAYYQVSPFSKKHLEIVKNQMEPYVQAGGKIGTAYIVEEPWYHQTYCDCPSMIKWKKEQGKWEFDYCDFDTWITFLLDEMKLSYVECYSIVPWENMLRYTENGVKRAQKSEPGTKDWLDAWENFLKDFIRHLEEKGWFDRMILAMDERPAKEMKEALILIERVQNAKGESLKVGGAVEHFDETIWEKFFTVTPHISSLVDNKIPVELFRRVVKERRRQGKLTSIYSMIGDYPGMFSMSDPAEAAWIIWYVEYCGADGFLKWAYDAWSRRPLEENVHPYFEAGDMYLVYPGENGKETVQVRTTPRFEMMAEAIGDIRKLRLMRKENCELKEKADQLLYSLKMFYGKGKNNHIGTAGFNTGDEVMKEELAEEVRRLHKKTVELSEEWEKKE